MRTRVEAGSASDTHGSCERRPGCPTRGAAACQQGDLGGWSAYNSSDSKHGASVDEAKPPRGNFTSTTCGCFQAGPRLLRFKKGHGPPPLHGRSPKEFVDVSERPQSAF